MRLITQIMELRFVYLTLSRTIYEGLINIESFYLSLDIICGHWELVFLGLLIRS